MVRTHPSPVSIFLQKCIQLGPNVRTGAVTGILRDQKNGFGTFSPQLVRVAFGSVALALQLLTDLDGGFQLPPRGRSRRRERNGAGSGLILAAMAGQRKIESVQRPVVDVLPNPKRPLLIRRKARHLRASRPCARPDFGGGKKAGMVQRNMPGPASAHGKSAQKNPIGVDLIALPDIGNRFEDVGLAYDVERHAIPAAIHVQLNLPFVSGIGMRGRHFLEAADEVGFSQSLVTTMQPDV